MAAITLLEPYTSDCVTIHGTIFGIQPDRGYLTTSSDVAYAFMASLIVANILMLIIVVYLAKVMSGVVLARNRFLLGVSWVQGRAILST